MYLGDDTVFGIQSARNMILDLLVNTYANKSVISKSPNLQLQTVMSNRMLTVFDFYFTLTKVLFRA